MRLVYLCGYDDAVCDRAKVRLADDGTILPLDMVEWNPQCSDKCPSCCIGCEKEGRFFAQPWNSLIIMDDMDRIQYEI